IRTIVVAAIVRAVVVAAVVATVIGTVVVAAIVRAVVVAAVVGTIIIAAVVVAIVGTVVVVPLDVAADLDALMAGHMRPGCGLGSHAHTEKGQKQPDDKDDDPLLPCQGTAAGCLGSCIHDWCFSLIDYPLRDSVSASMAMRIHHNREGESREKYMPGERMVSIRHR